MSSCQKEAWKIIFLDVCKTCDYQSKSISESIHLIFFILCFVILVKCFIDLAGGAQPLTWAIRMKVAIGAAKGLTFLHDAKSQVIYRDFKAANILLDAVINPRNLISSLSSTPYSEFHFISNQLLYRSYSQEFNSKLSDFGLAKAGPTGDKTHVSTQVMGTHGYAAPEYIATGEKLWL